MSPALAPSAPSPNAPSILQDVFNLWQSGNQQGALDLLAPPADNRETWALAMLLWLENQRGEVGWRAAFSGRVQEAIRLGLWWSASPIVSNVLANLNAYPDLIDQVTSLPSNWVWGPVNVDLGGPAWNALANGQPDLALRLLEIRYPFGVVTDDPALVESARQVVTDLQEIASTARADAGSTAQRGSEAREQIEAARARVETSAEQVKLYIDAMANKAISARYDQIVEDDSRESKSTFWSGLAVLALAAAVAVMPLAIYYLGGSRTYTTLELLAAHGTPSLALGAVSGVLLARSRNRDRSIQLARSFGTALETMILYSERIEEPVARQEFITAMGTLIFERSLGGSPTVDESPNPIRSVLSGRQAAASEASG